MVLWENLAIESHQRNAATARPYCDVTMLQIIFSDHQNYSNYQSFLRFTKVVKPINDVYKIYYKIYFQYYQYYSILFNILKTWRK